jgi:hypothetical protein
VQSEYFQRKRNGMLTDSLANTGSCEVTQSGWYLQSVYQFMPDWRTGVRYDRLDSGNASLGATFAPGIVSNYGFHPTRFTWMADYNASEFSRIRLQLAHDNTRQRLADNQLFVQYIMSLGAHGAHQY